MTHDGLPMYRASATTLPDNSGTNSPTSEGWKAWWAMGVGIGSSNHCATSMASNNTNAMDNETADNSGLWDEEAQLVKACAASILYRKRRRARLIVFPSGLKDLIRENQLIRLKDMVTQLLPGLKSRRKYDHEDIAYANCSFHEFIYNPFRNNPNGRIRLCSDLSHGQELFPVEVYSDTENCDPPVNFFYISNNDYSNYRGQCSQDSESIALVKCDCRSLVCGENCSCRQMNDLLNPCTIMGDGRVFVNTDATFYNTLIVGCGEKCACMAQCKNTLRSKCLPAPFKFEVFRRNDKLGFGVRTLSNIAHGCAVLEFCGEVLDGSDLDLRGSPSLDYAFCLQQADETEIYEKLKSAKLIQDESFEKWDRSVFVDPYRRGNVARFIAHGCFPNLTMLRYAENDVRLYRSRAILFANQPIAGGSELFFDYGADYLSRCGFACECGTLWCDNVASRWRSTDPTHGEMTDKSFAYFDYVENRMLELDTKAKNYLRDRGIVKPEYDDLDGADSGDPNSTCLRVEPSSVHKRNGDDAYTICYNLYCWNHSTCTCKPLTKFIPLYTIDD